MEEHDLTTDVWEIAREDFPTHAPLSERIRFLLRYAILAPSSHNSQPWEFVVSDSTIEIHAAEDRWLDVADRDKRELYVSLGCAIENLCIAAEQFDLGYEIDYHDDATPVATLTLSGGDDPRSERPPGLFDELTARYTNHQLFEDKPLSDDLREQFQDCVIEDGLTLHMIDDPNQKESIAELQAEADRRQMDNREYRRELAHWIGIGALGDSWLKARIGQAVVTYLDIGGSEAKKNSKLVTSAPTVGILVTGSDDPTARVRTGQVFERLALAATAAGVAIHPMSQILERPEMREELADILNIDNAQPQHLFRLGYPAKEQEHTPRWPLEAFLCD